MTIRVKLDEVLETMKNIEKEGKKITYMEDRYTFDKNGMLVRIEKEIDYH